MILLPRPVRSRFVVVFSEQTAATTFSSSSAIIPTAANLVKKIRARTSAQPSSSLFSSFVGASTTRSTTKFAGVRTVAAATAAAAAVSLVLVQDNDSRLKTKNEPAASSSYHHQHQDENPLPHDDDDDDNKVEEEEEEETACFLCRIHRQGPCRHFWRKFEQCVHHKTQNDSNDGDSNNSACIEYVGPFEECWTKHLNLYTLVALSVNQQEVALIERDVIVRKKWKDHPPKIDWSAWTDFIESTTTAGLNESWLREIASNKKKKLPLWKRFEEMGKEPILVQVSCDIPKRKDGMVLRAAYAVDQDDMVLGFAEHDQGYEKEKAKKENRSVSKQHSLKINLIPGLTKTVRILALYTEDPETNENKQQLDGFLLESPAIPLRTDKALSTKD